MVINYKVKFHLDCCEMVSIVETKHFKFDSFSTFDEIDAHIKNEFENWKNHQIISEFIFLEVKYNDY